MERPGPYPSSGRYRLRAATSLNPVTMNTKRFVRCFWGLDKSLAYSRHFPAIHWLTSYSEYLTDLSGWYTDYVSPKFVDYRNRLMALLNQESSLMEIVKLIGTDVLPDDQKLVLEIARVIRLGFLQQNAFHKDDTCVSLEKQFKMMDVILYLYKKSRELVAMGNADVGTEGRRNLRKSDRSQVRCAKRQSAAAGSI